MGTDQAESLLKFPCQIDVKAMGHADSGFEAAAIEIIGNHVPDLDKSALRTRPSSGGKYVAVTIRINATSREQMDAIYQDLTSDSRVLMAL